NVEHSTCDRLTVEIKHPALDQGRGSLLVEMSDVAAYRQFGRAQPMKRAKYSRLGGPVWFAMADQVDDHRYPERVRKQNKFLPLVAAHPAGFGQDLDRLEPLGLGKRGFFDESV